MTRNLTLAIDDDVLANYRVLAAQQKSSVNALIRKHMEEAVGGEARRREAIQKLLASSETTAAKIDMRGWNRESTYDRDQ